MSTPVQEKPRLSPESEQLIVLRIIQASDQHKDGIALGEVIDGIDPLEIGCLKISRIIQILRRRYGIHCDAMIQLWFDQGMPQINSLNEAELYASTRGWAGLRFRLRPENLEDGASDPMHRRQQLRGNMDGARAAEKRLNALDRALREGLISQATYTELKEDLLRQLAQQSSRVIGLMREALEYSEQQGI